MLKTLLYIVPVIIFNTTFINPYIGEDLIGTWRVDEFIANTPDLSPSIIQGAEVEALSSMYIFKKNQQVYFESDYVSEGQNGTWTFEDSTSIVTMTYPNGTTESYMIKDISGDKMVWHQGIEELGTISMVLVRKPLPK